jgi:glycosyltransferase involved in cell wall biosynthesis
MTTQRPLVSLGIPTYNSEGVIRDALDALLAQTYDNLELVISDNGSTDRTGEICQEYATKDRRVKYYRNPTNLGVHENYRRVVTLSTGEYFMWAADDDLKPPDAIEHCLNALSRNQRADMAHGIVLVQVPGGDLFEFPNVVQTSNTDAAARIRLFTRGIEHNAMQYGLYRLDSLRQATLGSHMGPEYLLLLQMFLLGEVEYVPVPLIIFRQRQRAPIRPPMYLEAAFTLRSILTANRLQRRKCWTVLLLGSYYLATRGKVPFAERMGAISAHITTFTSLYWKRLAKEVVFQVFQPVAWLSASVYRLARQKPTTLRLARKVKTCFIGTN